MNINIIKNQILDLIIVIKKHRLKKNKRNSIINLNFIIQIQVLKLTTLKEEIYLTKKILTR